MTRRPDWCFSEKERGTDYEGKTSLYFRLFLLLHSGTASYTFWLLLLNCLGTYVYCWNMYVCVFVFVGFVLCVYPFLFSKVLVYLCVCVGAGQRETSVWSECETTKQNVVHVSSKAAFSAQHGGVNSSSAYFNTHSASLAGMKPTNKKHVESDSCLTTVNGFGVNTFNSSSPRQIVLHREKEVKQTECDMAMVHHLLSRIPQDLPYELLISQSQELFDQYPPSLLAKRAALQSRKRWGN